MISDDSINTNLYKENSFLSGSQMRSFDVYVDVVRCLLKTDSTCLRLSVLNSDT